MLIIINVLLINNYQNKKKEMKLKLGLHETSKRLQSFEKKLLKLYAKIKSMYFSLNDEIMFVPLFVILSNCLAFLL